MQWALFWFLLSDLEEAYYIKRVCYVHRSKVTFNLRLYINIKTVNKKDLLQEGKKGGLDLLG